MTKLIELVRKPNVSKLEVQNYDFKTQTRIQLPKMGYPTMNTIQTFNGQGQPIDARQDSD